MRDRGCSLKSMGKSHLWTPFRLSVFTDESKSGTHSRTGEVFLSSIVGRRASEDLFEASWKVRYLASLGSNTTTLVLLCKP